eukprot:494220_1
MTLSLSQVVRVIQVFLKSVEIISMVDDSIALVADLNIAVYQHGITRGPWPMNNVIVLGASMIPTNDIGYDPWYDHTTMNKIQVSNTLSSPAPATPAPSTPTPITISTKTTDHSNTLSSPAPTTPAPSTPTPITTSTKTTDHSNTLSSPAPTTPAPSTP